ncbi:sulfate-binding domain protein [Leptospira borgpetersenii str. Brem 307]|nr:sulfate-binding domain protein [Leptospira borgpetersenii str. Brem 307]EMN15430.1 sulfate-binding domain protein [Leptospira borgpetersenii str. Brem 328]
MKTKILKSILIVLLITNASAGLFSKDVNLLNVSYDPTRELYAEYNKLFASYWKSKTGDEV